MSSHAAPDTINDDEKFIGKGYQSWLTAVIAIAPFVAVEYFELKYVLALGLGAILVLLHEIGGRLHDLCIRLRRTNILLKSNSSN